MTSADSLTTDAILDALATAGRVLPRTALKQAVQRWPELAPALLALLEAIAAGADLTDRTEATLFCGIYLMAQFRETRAFAPLCAIAANDGQMDQLIGDGITEDLSIILARTYGGDPAPLRTLIEDEDADEFVRDAALGALSWLTVTGRIDRDDTARYLRELHATLRPQGECWVWAGWQEAIAVLGLAELAPLVEDVIDREWIDNFTLSLEDFQEALRAAQQAADPATAFPGNIKDDGRLDDAEAHLSTWASFQPEEKPVRRPVAPTPARTPIHNPYRGVGRNDPCPCGSGKKYKKCCLNAAL